MRFFTAVALAFSLASTVHGFCGTKAGSKEEMDEVRKQIQSLPQSKIDITNRTLSKDGAFTVPVVWHVFSDINNPNNPNDGAIPDGAIYQTQNVINSFFRQVGLTFALNGIQRHPISSDILRGVAPGNRAEAIIKSYGRGNAQTLNIYTVTALSPVTDGTLAYATFPWEYRRNPRLDGIVVSIETLPGGDLVENNTGKVLVHEIGHWVGLLHTFEGGCYGGDDVADTPAEASPARGCPPYRDTCGQPGPDPIHNMMDYTNDFCRTHFTPGQYNRMTQILYQYRGINLY